MKKTNEVKKKFLEIIEGGNTITKACKLVGIHRSTFYEWRDQDVDFALNLMRAQQVATEITDEVAGFHYHQKVRQGDTKFLKKWLDERHPEYAKKTLRIAFDLTENRGAPIIQTVDKDELFVRLRAFINSGMVGFSDIPKELELEFWNWYEANYPGGPKHINKTTQDYISALYEKAYENGVKSMRKNMKKEDDISE
ncbi:MAG TPA: hypothetical protein PKA60_00655 [Candidatus Paceibacterota bacterium]|nr:hypothetical protein [Candidatus Paceibacterota bacterium]